MDDDEIITDEPEPTKDEVIAKAQALMDEMAQLQDEYAHLDPDAQAQYPEWVRRFLGPQS